MRKKWTETEIEYMLKYYLNQPVEKTAKSLGRTVVSVKRKATKLGLNHYLDNLGAKAVARCFGCDISVVLRWIEKFNLPAGKITCNNQIRYSIDIEKFWKWAKENKHVINWSRYEIGSLVPEPEWVKEEKSSFENFNSRKRFTAQEKSYIRYLFLKGKNYKEISAETGRSYHSINHLCRNILRT